MSDERAELLADLPGIDSGRSVGFLRRLGRRHPVLVGIVGVVLLIAAGWGIRASFDANSPLFGWYRIVPPLVAITAALITGRLYLSLVSGVVAGG